MAFCTGCGSPVLEPARFCAHCGQKLARQDDVVLRPAKTAPFGVPSLQVRPWVRYWARSIDIYLFCIICLSVVMATDAAYPGILTAPTDITWGVAFLFAWVFVEALFLSTFGATPGKWLLRTAITADDGEAPSYSQALGRSMSVWWRGMALGLPLFNIVAMIYGYRRLTTQGITSWDEEGRFSINHDRIGPVRIITAAMFLIAASISFIAIAASDTYKREDYVSPSPALVTAAPRATDTDTGDDRAIVAPVKAPTPTAPVPVDAAAESARWDADSAAFEAAHPDIKYGQNSALMQEKANTLYVNEMTNATILEVSYRIASEDARWSRTP